MKSTKKAFFCNNIIYIWLYGLFDASKHYRVPLSYDLTTFQILGQKFVKFFVGILVQTMRPKGHFEINWPLVEVSSLQPKLTFVIGNGNQE